MSDKSSQASLQQQGSLPQQQGSSPQVTNPSDGWNITSIIPSHRTCALVSLTSVVCGAIGYYYYNKKY
jgi:hypothetical protein